jgi:hypothetical protein
VTQHRVDQVAARQQPVPGRLPSPDEILEIGPESRPPAGRRLLRRPRRWLHSARRTLRTRRGKWVLIALACVAVLLVGLLAAGFLSPASAPSGDLPPPADLGIQPSFGDTSPAPSESAAKDKQHGDSPSTGGVSNPLAALRAKFPDNPLNHLRGAGLHRVSISVSSGSPVLVLGYLVPTGLGSSYGQVSGHPRHWSMSERAIGRGYLAAIFVQAGRDGSPATCRVTVDGKVTDSESTSSSYGRAVCLG